MHYVSCIRRYNALMNKVIWISGVTVSTRAKALVLTVTPLMHINLFISALYLRMHSTRALSYTYPIFYFEDTASITPPFLNFAGIKCPRTELSRKNTPFLLKFKTRVRTHSQWYVPKPGGNHQSCIVEHDNNER